MGPVQVLVVGFDEPVFTGEVVAELTRLRDAGIVRLVDLLLVSRSEDGALETIEPPADLGAGYGGLATSLLGGNGAGSGLGAGRDEPANSPAWSLGDAVPRGTTAAVALIEHVWAKPLLTAIHGAGGAPLDETWLAPGDVARLEAMVAARDGS